MSNQEATDRENEGNMARSSHRALAEKESDRLQARATFSGRVDYKGV